MLADIHEQWSTLLLHMAAKLVSRKSCSVSSSLRMFWKLFSHTRLWNQLKHRSTFWDKSSPCVWHLWKRIKATCTACSLSTLVLSADHTRLWGLFNKGSFPAKYMLTCLLAFSSCSTRWLVRDRHFTQGYAIMRSSIHQADFSGNGKSIAKFISDQDALKMLTASSHPVILKII